jgi:hypothetical protein
VSLERISADDFTPALGGSFTLSAAEDVSLELELLAAETYPAGAPARDDSGRRTPFRVRFRGPAEPLLEQRIYRVEHDSVGALDVFLVPLGVGEEGALYEAIFA